MVLNALPYFAVLKGPRLTSGWEGSSLKEKD